MPDNEPIEKALQGAHSADVAKLYDFLVGAIVAAQNDQNKINVAKEKFQKGLQISKLTYDIAKEAAGL